MNLVHGQEQVPACLFHMQVAFWLAMYLHLEALKESCFIVSSILVFGEIATQFAQLEDDAFKTKVFLPPNAA